MGTFVSPTGTQMMIDDGPGAPKAEQTGVLYYDGSEEYYDHGDYPMPEADTVVTGFGYSIKTIVEEPLAVKTPNKQDTQSAQKENIELPSLEAESIAELPASPVPRRITRELILAALEPVSTGEYGSTSAFSPEVKGQEDSASKDDTENVVVEPAKQEIVMEAHQAKESRDVRYSVVSQARTSLMDSSTIELAVRYASPEVSGNGSGHGNGTTSDGMSDLLDGYQHSVMKDDDETSESQSPKDVRKQKKRGLHTPKSSDAQSFKSCTDLPEHPYKDSDALSFSTCKDAVTPERHVSMPTPSLPSSRLGESEPKMQRPASDMPPSSPPTVLRKKAPFSVREASLPGMGAKIRANTKPSSRNGSAATSIASSFDAPAPQPPSVPPRESSTSKEAQRTTAVASYLLRGFRSGAHFRGFGSSKMKHEVSASSGHNDDASRLDKKRGVSPLPSHVEDDGRSSCYSTDRDTPSARPSVCGTEKNVRFPESARPPIDDLDKLHMSSATSSKEGAFARAPVEPPATPVHQRMLTSPSTALVEPSSMYSPGNNSSSFKSRVQPSPPGLSKSPSDNFRDSQSTTHLVWPARKSLHVRSTTTPERHRPISSQDDTTTDLRFSSYRPNLMMHYLPDLKEESHEDSSLNTSASNLKNSSFRFPIGGQPSVRASVDDGAFLARHGSVKSNRNGSGLAQTRVCLR
jgi:hypothetical protein